MNPNLLASAVPHTALVQLADLDENKVTPGLLGFVVFALIGGATWFLMKNMNKQLTKIDFQPAREGHAGAVSSDAGSADVETQGSDTKRDASGI